MAWKGRGTPPIDFANLIVSLNKTGLNTSNQPLYQTIKDLIDKSQSASERQTFLFQSIVGNIRLDDTDNLASVLNQISIINAILQGSQFLTAADESINLPNSRQLVAGLNITFDDTVPNVRTINSTDGTGVADYVVASDGVIAGPSPINDGAGNFIYVAYTP